MRFIIDFVDSVTDLHVTEYLSANECTLVREFNNFSRTYLVEAEAAPPVTDIVESVVLDDTTTKIRLLEADTKTISTVDDDNWWKLAVIAQIDLNNDEVELLRGGRGVRVYLLDSGIAADHPDFAGKDITLLHSLTPGDFSDTTGHGTALASVIVGETCGITESALKVVKIFHKGQATLMSDLLAAFDAVMDDYLSNGDALAVMNLSWAIEKNDYLEQKIQDMIEVGLFAVSAAGNEGRAISEVTPASMRDVITVGAFDQDLRPCDFSNYTGPTDTSYTAGEVNHGALDYFAPGVAIRVAKPDGTFGYTVGTSIAAAITSAVLALRVRHSGYTWDKEHAENEVDYMVRAIGVPGLLTLEGVYANSPNLIPVINIATLSNRPAPRVVFAQAGEKISMWAFSPEVSTGAISGPAWLTLDGNYYSGIAPSVTERYESFEFTLSLTNIASGEVEDVSGIAIIRRPDVTHEEAKEESRPVAIQFNSCADFCTYYCCECCEGKDEMCIDCYRPTHGCYNAQLCP